ncbi:hypothetical protein F6S82_16295 [Bacteroides xylanisolvens]|uniref:Uncharacterized protein n=1 Tax=Bacteroides xylanisolvens TaxID=371601 RepID=A0AAI9WH44_9BACE|nr:hypothetical protein F6S82_16295 [Bacteroides xylanisolvens]
MGNRWCHNTQIERLTPAKALCSRSTFLKKSVLTPQNNPSGISLLNPISMFAVSSLSSSLSLFGRGVCSRSMLSKAKFLLFMEGLLILL